MYQSALRGGRRKDGNRKKFKTRDRVTRNTYAVELIRMWERRRRVFVDGLGRMETEWELSLCWLETDRESERK